MRPAAVFVHPGGRGGPVDVPLPEDLRDLPVARHDPPRQIFVSNEHFEKLIDELIEMEGHAIRGGEIGSSKIEYRTLIIF